MAVTVMSHDQPAVIDNLAALIGVAPVTLSLAAWHFIFPDENGTGPAAAADVVEGLVRLLAQNWWGSMSREQAEHQLDIVNGTAATPGQ